MNSDDFKLGTIFLYSNLHHPGGELLGIGEVIDVRPGKPNFTKEVKIRWLWSPAMNISCQEEWYIDGHRIAWEHDCKILTEKEKFSLILKHNFE